MRALVVLVVASLVAPFAVAKGPPAPAVFVTYDFDEDNLLVWSPVAEAEFYVIYRGSSLATLAPYDITTQPFYVDPAPIDGVYGVAASDGVQESEVRSAHPAGPGGNCVSANTNLHVTVQASNCVNK